MRLLKLSIILLLIQLLLFASLSAQEGENINTDPGGSGQSSNSDTIPVSGEDGVVSKEKENTQTPDLTNKGKTESGDDAKKKSPAKKKPEIKPVQKNEEIRTDDAKTEEIKTEEIKAEEIKTDAVKVDTGLLSIDEGNFKYKRIPEIKLIEPAPELAEKSIAVETPAESGEKPEKSYMDVWKILIILIAVGIFILYNMSRASVSAKRRSKISKSRKVLNSYRK